MSKINSLVNMKSFIVGLFLDLFLALKHLMQSFNKRSVLEDSEK